MSRKVLAGLAILALVLVVAGVAQWRQAARTGRLLRDWADTVPAQPDLVRLATARAMPVFAAQCATCHGANMKGDRVRGVPDLTDADWLFGTGEVSEIEQTILYGIRSGHHRTHSLADMPAFGEAKPYWRYDLPTLTDAEIADVTQYILLAGHRLADAAAAARGMAIYNGRAQCYDCHTSDARGDTYVGAANLTDSVWLYGDGSAAAIARSIEGGHAGICPAWVGRLSPTDIRALAVLIHDVSHAQRLAMDAGRDQR